VDPVYQEPITQHSVRKTLEKVLALFNESRTGGEDKMNLLLFDYMVSHLSRVARIINKP
jgi:hypothetical protein